jgi:hypothetical protein
MARRGRAALGTTVVPIPEWLRCGPQVRRAARVLAAMACAASPMQVLGQTSAPVGILLAAGDISKCGSGKPHEKTAALLKAQLANAGDTPVHILALGDLAYDSGSETDFKCFDKVWGKHKRLILPVAGNHEYEQASAAPYYNYFRQAPKGAAAGYLAGKLIDQNGPGAGYYSLRFPDKEKGPWHLLGLNSGPVGPIAKPQIAWLKNELNAPLPCVIAFWHHPVFSSGRHGHGDCPKSMTPAQCNEARVKDVCRPNDSRGALCNGTQRGVEAFRILYERGASAVLNGHDHNYEQFSRRGPDGAPDPKGVRVFVVGTGGGPLYNETYDVTWRYPDSKNDGETYVTHTHGVLVMKLFADRYSWELMRTDGVAVASGNDSCNARGAGP